MNRDDIKEFLELASGLKRSSRMLSEAPGDEEEEETEEETEEEGGEEEDSKDEEEVEVSKDEEALVIGFTTDIEDRSVAGLDVFT